MKNHRKIRSLAAFGLMVTLTMIPVLATAQTRISLAKNKYSVQDDVKVGREAARQVERQMPLLNDRQVEAYVARVGEKLVSAIPPQFQQPAFDYTFKVVNANDINAFALPGGPMYVNRGMIQAARNEGEMAGVMAHEISHVALRHATAQITKQNSVGNLLGRAGLIFGGAILGGDAGAQAGAAVASVWQTKYSRDYETQADILGSQIMADAGYDPRDLANMFQTIARQGGGSAPEWMSSHPDPGNRYQKINQEAALLNVSSNPIKVTQEFSRIQERLSGMPRARTMSEIEQGGGNSGGGQRDNPMAGGQYSQRIAFPMGRMRTYNANGISFDVPSEWREFSQGSLTFAPDGAYGDQGITHGVMIGAFRPRNSGAANAAREYVSNMLQSNSYLTQQSNLTGARISGRQGYTTTLSGRSPVTGRNETVTIYTVPLRSGDLLYVAAVAPETESYRYSSIFRSMIGSLQLND